MNTTPAPGFEYKAEVYTDCSPQVVTEQIAREQKQGWEPVSHTYADRTTSLPLRGNHWSVLYRRPKQEKEASK